MIKTVVLDFNGTLLDDVDLCLHCLNRLVKKYLARPEVSKEEYLRIFTFPVKDYYEKIGFNFAEVSFASLGQEWFSYYQEGKEYFHLYKEAIPFLQRCQQQQIECVLLSASRKQDLLAQCAQLKITSYFTEIWGISDIYAHGKIALAKQMMKKRQPEECLFIGDSLHDKEVADAVGCACVLLANGHQAVDVLRKAKTTVVNTLQEVIL